MRWSFKLTFVQSIMSYQNTVECRYNVAHYNMILMTSLQLLRENTNQIVNQQKHPVYLVRIFNKNDLVIMVPHCIMSEWYQYTEP